VIDRLVDAGASVERCCLILGVARQNYYKDKRTATTPTQLRQQWLTGLVREVHVASRGTYGYRRIHAELTLGMGITVCPRTVSVLMTRAGIYGLPEPVRVKRLRGVVTANDLVNRKIHRIRRNELWVNALLSTAHVKGGCTAARCSMRSAAESWGGRSIRAPTRHWWSMRWIWPSAIAAPQPAASFTPITELSSPLGCSAKTSAPQGYCRPSGRR
jgi:hypothetical protein